jgi:hypothetical protein
MEVRPDTVRKLRQEIANELGISPIGVSGNTIGELLTSAMGGNVEVVDGRIVITAPERPINDPFAAICELFSANIISRLLGEASGRIFISDGTNVKCIVSPKQFLPQEE